MSEEGQGDSVLEIKYLKGKSGGSPQGAALQCFAAAGSCGLESQTHSEPQSASMTNILSAKPQG